MTTQEIISQAYAIGYETRKNSGSAVPAQSTNLMNLISSANLSIGELTPVLNSFNKGFHACGFDILIEKQKQMQVA